MPTLHVLQGSDKGRTYHTPDEPALIGRHSDHIQLADDGASRQHAELKLTDGAWLLVDLNSSNGTFVNGQRIVGPTRLQHGDQIKIGSTLMVFSGDDETVGVSGAQKIHDLVDLDLSAAAGGSSILSAIDGSEESVILQAPETADAVAAWNVIYKVAETIGTVERIDAFLERVTDILFNHLIMDHLILLMFDENHDKLLPQVVRYRSRERRGRAKIHTSQTIINHALDKKEGVLCANALTDVRFSSENPQDSIHRLGLRSVICVPIIAHGTVEGVFHFDCSMSHHSYSQEQLRLAVAIGRLTGMAIENARLLESKVQTARLAAAGETVAYLSHHIRNMLQGMQGGAEVVELGLRKHSLESAETGWAMVRRNLDRIYHLTLNMLTFSKDRQPRIQSTQVNKVIEDVVALAQARADEKGVMLLAEMDEIPAIPTDPDGVHQIMHNIIRNAIEAAPKEGGRVNIRSGYDMKGGQIELSVTDNGHGITEEGINKIFDAFSSTKGLAGTGLGLAAAKKIIAELGGAIDVRSSVEEGSTFVIRLPAVHVKLADADKTHGPMQ